MAVGIDTTLTLRDDGTSTIQRVAGELKKLEQAAKQSAATMSAAWGAAKTAAVSLVAAVTGGGIIEFLHRSSELALENQRAFEQMRFAVETATDKGFGNFNLVVEKTIEHVARLAVVTKDEATKGLQVLTTNTGDLAGSLENLALVFDLAAAKGLNVETAAKFVSLAMTGNLQTLGRLLPEFKGMNKEFDETTTKAEMAAHGLDVLRQRVTGAGQAMGDEQKRVREFKKDMQELGESVGETTLKFGAFVTEMLRQGRLNPNPDLAGKVPPAAEAITPQERAQQIQIKNMQQLKQIAEEYEALAKRREAQEKLLQAGLLKTLDVQKFAVENLKLAVKPTVEQIEKMDALVKSLTEKSAKLLEQRQKLTEEGAVATRALLKGLGAAPDEAMPLETQLVQALATFKELAAQAGGETGLLRKATEDELEKMVPQVRDLLAQAYSPDFVKRQVTEMMAQVTRLRTDVVDEQRKQVDAQKAQVQLAVEAFQQIAIAAQDNLGKIADTISRLMGRAAEDARKRFQEALQSIMRDSAALGAAIGQAGANIGPSGLADSFIASSVAAAEARGNANQDLFGPGFAAGGSFMVRGSGGTDSQRVSFKATPGEQVTVTPPGQGAGRSGGGPVTINVYSTNADPRAVAKEVRRELLRLERFA